MVIDFLFIVLLIMAAFKGFTKGLVVAVFSFFAVIIGLAAAMKLSAVVAGWLHNATSIGVRWLPLLSFALVMFGVVLLVRWGAVLVEKSFSIALMGWLNKLGGFILYAALYTTILSVVLFFADKVGIIKPQTFADAEFYGFIQPWGPAAINGFGKVIPIFKDLFTQLEGFFEGLSK